MVSAIKTALESQPAVGGFGVISFTSVGNTPLDPVPIVETDNSAEQLAIILGVSIPALLIIIFLVLFILYRKGIILNGKSVRVLEASNSDDGNPSSSNKVVADELGSGMAKIIEIK